MYYGEFEHHVCVRQCDRSSNPGHDGHNCKENVYVRTIKMWFDIRIYEHRLRIQRQ